MKYTTNDLILRVSALISTAEGLAEHRQLLAVIQKIDDNDCWEEEGMPLEEDWKVTMEKLVNRLQWLVRRIAKTT